MITGGSTGLLSIDSFAQRSDPKCQISACAHRDVCQLTTSGNLGEGLAAGSYTVLIMDATGLIRPQA